MGRSRLYHACSFNFIQYISNLLPASFQLQFTASYERILDAIKAMIPAAASEQGIEKRSSNATCVISTKRYKELKVRVQTNADRYLSSEIYSLSPCNC